MKGIKKLLSILLVFAMLLGTVAAAPIVSKAASASVSSYLSDDLTSQVFVINANGNNLYYDVERNGALIESRVPVSGTVTRSFAELNAFYSVYVYEVDPETGYGYDIAYAVSPASHNYNVTYVLDGSTSVVIESGQIGQGEVFTFEADEYFAYNGKEYDIDASRGTIQDVYFGKSNYIFYYNLYNPADEEVIVDYVDTSGNYLGGKTASVSYYGSDVTLTLDETITDADGREYRKVSQTNTITVNYFSPSLYYEIEYQLVNAPQVGPYSVEVVYESTDGVFLGNRYYTINTGDGEVQLPEAPTTLSQRSGGTLTYYEIVNEEDLVILHDEMSDVRQYVVKYQAYDQKKPYMWSVRLVDAATGDILATKSIEIEAEGSASYEADSLITVDDTNYVLDGGMAKSYSHQYGDNRITNIYYNAESEEVVTSYDLNIRYRSVSTDEVLYEVTQKVTPEQAVTIDAPSEYENGGKEYVKLAGQEEAINHDYYNPQRTYTVYYRDINDLQNVDTYVTIEEIVTSDRLVDVEEDTEEETVTSLTNDTTGERVSLDDESVPLSGSPIKKDGNNILSLGDGETPKGLLATAATSPMTLVIFGGLAVLAVILFFVLGKKKNEQE